MWPVQACQETRREYIGPNRLWNQHDRLMSPSTSGLSSLTGRIHSTFWVVFFEIPGSYSFRLMETPASLIGRVVFDHSRRILTSMSCS